MGRDGVGGQGDRDLPPGGDLDVAGSFALSIAETDTRAALGGTVTAGGDDILLSAASTQETTVSASAGTKTGKTGVGAAIAIDVSNMRVEAEILASVVTGADDVTLMAKGSGKNTVSGIGGTETAGVASCAKMRPASTRLKLTTSAPEPASNLRRENVRPVMLPLLPARRA